MRSQQWDPHVIELVSLDKETPESSLHACS